MEETTVQYKRYFRTENSVPVGVILAELQSDGTAIIAVSKCHPKDAFDKRRGSEVAQIRLHDEGSKARFVAHSESLEMDMAEFFKTRRRFFPMHFAIQQVASKALGLENR